MKITVNELIEMLEDVRNMHGGEVPVMLATQPRYPLAHFLDAGCCVQTKDGKKMLWLREGDSSYEDPYAPRDAFTEEEISDETELTENYFGQDETDDDSDGPCLQD